MKIRDIKISVRLGVCFAALIAVMCVIAVVGVKSLWVVSDATDEIVNDRYVKVALVNQIGEKVNIAARALRNAIIAPDQATADKYLERAKNGTREVNEHMADLEKRLNTPKAKEIFDRLKEARAGYAKPRDKLWELIGQQKKAEASEHLFKEVIPAQDRYFVALNEMTAFQASLMDQSVAKSNAASANAVNTVVVLSAVAVVLSVLAALWITRSITRPLNEAVQVATAVAAGDLTVQIAATSKDETGVLLASLKSMNDNLHRIVSLVREGTDTINTASSEIATGNLDLSSRTEEQAGALEETASAMEELTSTVKQNADNARQANTLAETASQVAIQGGSVVSEVVQTMSQINDASRKIVDIISVIDGIAFQTNILALNAAVEAARAGEQGRGFAVVASEVRTLAQRSAAAAKEIKGLIDTSVERVDNGSRLVEQAGHTMEEVVASVKRVTDVVAEITAASGEQSDGIEQINQAIVQMDEVTQQNAALVEEAAAAAQSLQEQSGRLVETVSIFKLSSHDQQRAAAPAAAPRTQRTVDVTPRPAALPRKPVAKPSSASSAPARQPTVQAAAAVDGDWEQF
ncbi:methyl-accepting chemotaxis protein [Herbaspirillum rubrisubalbicans]|uniref:methyl-accepting chemotaxis protein n=1 Tax=Herbaspirillum rubrisubalbicans TaxID=80842 RepID=UPI00155851CD|nr:methyl-accepting chemotaxis protein [Herbaspirillum rubrisubalbicans]NQE49090.1 chemotaxis protein [Herbaspirillum rubrisubalbicans]